MPTRRETTTITTVVTFSITHEEMLAAIAAMLGLTVEELRKSTPVFHVNYFDSEIEVLDFEVTLTRKEVK